MSDGREDEADELVREFLSESNESLDQFESTLLEAERVPGSRSQLAALFRSVHSIKGSCGFLGFARLESLLHEGETLLGRVREGRIPLDAEVASALLGLVDGVRRILVTIEATGKEGELDVSRAIALLESLTRRAATSISPSTSAVSAASSHDVLHDETSAPSLATGKIRVDVGLLDRLMNLVGELVLARNQVLQFSTERSAAGAFAPVQRLNLVTTELQETVMKTRMQPIGNIWNRFPRIVRDLGRASGKRIALRMEGRETELDKSIIEAIQDPLAHLVRNAVDHGIESPDARARQGKPAEATLSLRAFHGGGMVNIEIADDGAGIDLGQVKRRALALGLASADDVARMTDREAVSLLFLPGFTTTDRVTTVSGRGVGMDVVRTNVEKVGGTVDIETRRGQGTSIKIKIPLTLAIIPALIVGCGAARYAIPQATVLEIVRLGGEHDKPQIEDIQGAPVFRRRGRLLPLAFLRRELDLRDGYAEARDSGVIVVLEADDRSFGLVVDEILDTDEIVVKPIWKRLKSLSCYAGATVMGDGKVALVLDSIGLARKVGVVSEIRQRAVAHAAPAEAGEREEELVVLCRLGTEGHLAIPLSCVTRLEDLPRSRIERVGGANVAQYRGEILPLVEASRVLEERRKHPRHSGDARSSAQAGSAQVVVFAHKGRRLGLIVDAILDVVGVRIALQRQACRAGILGSMVVRDRVTEFLDVDYVIRAAAPSAISESVALGDA